MSVKISPWQVDTRLRMLAPMDGKVKVEVIHVLPVGVEVDTSLKCFGIERLILVVQKLIAVLEDGILYVIIGPVEILMVYLLVHPALVLAVSLIT